jgi:hypothetical protein
MVNVSSGEGKTIVDLGDIVGKDGRRTVRIRKRGQIRRFALSKQQQFVLAAIYRGDEFARQVQQSIFQRGQKYTDKGFPNKQWEPLTPAQRASYSRSIRRLESSEMIRIIQEPADTVGLGARYELTPIGEVVVQKLLSDAPELGEQLE